MTRVSRSQQVLPTHSDSLADTTWAPPAQSSMRASAHLASHGTALSRNAGSSASLSLRPRTPGGRAKSRPRTAVVRASPSCAAVRGTARARRRDFRPRVLACGVSVLCSPGGLRWAGMRTRGSSGWARKFRFVETSDESHGWLALASDEAGREDGASISSLRYYPYLSAANFTRPRTFTRPRQGTCRARPLRRCERR